MTIIALLLLLFSTAFSEALEFQEETSLILKGEEALESWDVEEAEKILKGLKEEGEPRVLLFAAKVKFYKGDYQAALDLISRAREGGYAGGDSANLSGVITRTEEAARGFIVKESPHFRLRVKPGKDEILRDYALDALEKAYTRTGEDLGYFPTEKVLVEIYPDLESFIKISTLSRKDIETSGTVAICKFARINILTPRALLRGYAWLDTLSHEYVHYIINRKTRGTVPIWLHEGIAKYEELRWRKEKPGELTPSSQTILAKALKKGSIISFEKMHPSLAKLDSAEQAQLAFAEVSTAVEYIFDKWGRDTLHDLLQNLTKGKTEAQVCVSALKLTCQEFFTSWRTWAMGRSFKEIPGLKALPLRFRKGRGSVDAKQAERDELKEVPSDAARKHLRLGDLLRDRNRIDAAIVEYQKATRKGVLSPVAFNKLALAFMLNRDLDSALGPLIRARELFPDFVTTYVHLGQIYLERRDYDRSMENFIFANSLNPFDPRIHASLATIYKEKGMTDAQAREEHIYGLLR